MLKNDYLIVLISLLTDESCINIATIPRVTNKKALALFSGVSELSSLALVV